MRNTANRSLVVLLGLTASAVMAEQEQRSAAEVYKETCIACHGSGVADAPVFGDEGDWQSLIEEGQAVVTAHGWVGEGAMPPRGGNPELSIEEFARAVAYMGREAGADWRDPDAALLEEIAEEERKRLEELEARH